jgi:hypothetical protein
LQHQLAGFDALGIDEVLRQREHLPRAGLNTVRQIRLLWVQRTRIAIEHQLGERVDHAERVLEVVAHRRQQVETQLALVAFLDRALPSGWRQRRGSSG